MGLLPITAGSSSWRHLLVGNLNERLPLSSHDGRYLPRYLPIVFPFSVDLVS